jgi:hypothetical protein
MVAGMVTCLAASGMAKHKKEESEDFRDSSGSHHHKKHYRGGDYANLEDIEDEMVNPSMRSGVSDMELTNVRFY